VIGRRVFISSLAGGLLGAPLAAAQPGGKVPRIGFLGVSSPTDAVFRRFFEAFRGGLAELGYVEGQSIAIEARWAAGQYERLPALAAELVRLKVAVIVTAAVPAIRAARDATRTIPIVMAAVVDPVSTGLVAGLARPGGNITGLSVMSPELVGKHLEMLREILPKVSRVAVLWNPTNLGNPPQLRAGEQAARALGMQLQPLEAKTSGEVDEAFAAMTREGAGALVVLVDILFSNQRTQIARLAATRRLPTVYGLTEHVGAGGLMAYAPSFVDQYRRAAVYVDKILKGASPGDLPIEQPTKFELVINLKTARTLGLAIPPSLLGRADEVIQ
jgi:putative tryptophan/tyrosine transport system substrate-binding protein